MIVVTSALRSTRRSRRGPSLASLLRALGSVRISDSPPAWCTVDRGGPPQEL